MNEKYLFHGTEYDAAQKITVQGFLRDHGRVMAFGRGTYFAKTAAMSIGYSPQDNNGYHWMFLCAVILGESCPGSRSYQVPPSKPNSSVHYESMVDSIINPQIFVISKDYQAYPLFLIKFSPSSASSNISTNNNMSIVGLMNGLNLLQMQPNNNYNNNGNKKKKKKKNKSPSKSKNSKSLIPIKMGLNSNKSIMNNNNKKPLSKNNNNVISTNNKNNGNKNLNNNNNGNQVLFPGPTTTTSLVPALNPVAQVMAIPTTSNPFVVPTAMTMPLILPMPLNNNNSITLQPTSFGLSKPTNLPHPSLRINTNTSTQSSNQRGSNVLPSNVISSTPVTPVLPLVQNATNPFRPMSRQNNNNYQNNNNPHNNNNNNNKNISGPFFPSSVPATQQVNSNNNNNQNGGQTVMNVMNTMTNYNNNNANNGNYNMNNKPQQQQQQQQGGFKLQTGSNNMSTPNVPDPFRQQSPLLTALSTPQSMPQSITSTNMTTVPSSPIVSISQTPPNSSPFIQYDLPQNINDLYSS